MQITGTKAAFLKILEEKAVYKKLGVSHSTVANWKRIILTGDISNGNVSTDKMEEMLARYGAALVRDKIWDVK